VVKTADFWNLHDLASRRRVDRPRVGGVLVEREMGARVMVIAEVTLQDAAQVSLAQDEDVVEALAANRTDHPVLRHNLVRLVGRTFGFA
jgi:hypothetical protein